MIIPEKTLKIASVEDWTDGLINGLRHENGLKGLGYAKADLLFVLIAAAILAEETPTQVILSTTKISGGPTIATGSNRDGDLLSKPSVQSAMKEFIAKDAALNDIYERWESELTKKDADLPIVVWRGIASKCVKLPGSV